MSSSTHVLSEQPKKEFSRVFEFFLFVHPLDKTALQAEEAFLDFTQEERKQNKIFFRIISYNDMRSQEALGPLSPFPCKTVAETNALYQKLYHYNLGYKAALLQGKKKGRQFLLNSQSNFMKDATAYDLEQLTSLVEELGLDVEMWKQDLESESVKKQYQEDIRFARLADISTSPSLVIFDNMNRSYGFQINSCCSRHCLEAVADWLNDKDESQLLPYHCNPPFSLHLH